MSDANTEYKATRLHHLKPAEGAKKSKIRVGRGDRGRRGKTAGRGTKGTGARGTVPAWLEGGNMPLIRTQPKLPGFNNPNKIYYSVVNVETLEELFTAGDEVNYETLLARGVVRKKRPVKVLAHGEITKALTINVAKISGSARDKITAAGGTVLD
jgi:large subunit ribosomal protein L15